MFYLVIDIGASSGRHIVGWQEDGAIQTKEVYRFPNGVREENDHLIWDVRKLFSHVVTGIMEAFKLYPEIESLSIDTWGVARMSGVLSDEQVLALIDMINRKKGGFRNFLKQTFQK